MQIAFSVLLPADLYVAKVDTAMTTPVAPAYLCPNGHGGPTFASARFCNQCGAAYAPYAPPNYTQPAAPMVPPPQPQWGTAPA